jgi:exopolysaccharide biosynthesis polyprenyl glycosylphosphotransferase
MDWLAMPLVDAAPSALIMPIVSSVAHANLPSYLRVRAAARRVVILTDGEPGPLLNRICRSSALQVEVVDVIDLGDAAKLDWLAHELQHNGLREKRISTIIVGSSDQKRLPSEFLLHCRVRGIPVLSEAGYWEREAQRIDFDGHDASWFLCTHGFRYSPIEAMQKRSLDVLIAIALLVLTLPLMLLVALLIRCDSRGPILYRQKRVGLGGRVFTLYKFRSMREDAEAAGEPRWAATADPRITRIGRFIRYTRIDELPQLLNVLRGDMSMIGPRPERPYFVDMLAAAIPLYAARHWVKPGITGWAQVNAPYGASVEGAREKLAYDLYYIKRRGFLLDVLILLRTLRVVFLQEGAR